MAILNARPVDSPEPEAGPAVEVTPAEVVLRESGGAVRWRHAFAPPSATTSIARGSGWLSANGEHVWVFRPDEMLGRGEGDGWLVLSASDGQLVAEVPLPTVGQGAGHLPHPDGVRVLLDVGEGQDGTCLFLGRLDGTTLEVHAYPWTDRVASGFSPDGSAFMTVDHDQNDAAFHVFPSGDRTRTVELDDLPPPETDEDVDLVFGWGGGYLDGTRAVVIVEQHTDEDETRAFHVLDLTTGAVLGRLAVPEDAYDIELPGDGTWIVRDEDGRPSRWALA
ncbi:hypothetical protein [Lentzea sp. NBRC 102530]|uniref:hypothetical protein n=1 Tax=Lentzea sp. NBRC 102530 TaxID=3032201 RepID=UPI0024A0C93C|nr:hypothetical protein [Lentzea sp. NBRC 102530]GLY51575.1 hypothetical protein Lesp01_52310 [Lentzea sp. NBRC 102530]